MREFSTFCVCVLVVFALSIQCSSWAHTQPTPPPSPLEVRSDSLQVDTKTQRATLSGNILVRHRAMTLTCDTLNILYDPQGQPLEMIAEGSIKVSYKDIYFTSKRAKYLRKKGAALSKATLTFTGSPRAVQRSSKLSAQSITLDLHTGHIRATKPQGSLPLPTPNTP